MGEPQQPGAVVGVYDARALESLLPHRYPFLLVDRIEVLEAGRRVVGSKRLTSTEWWADATAAVPMPFPLVLEALAQTGGTLIPDLAGSTTGVVAYFSALIVFDIVEPFAPGTSCAWTCRCDNGGAASVAPTESRPRTAASC